MKPRRSLVMLVVTALLVVGCTERRLESPREGEHLGVAVDINAVDLILTAGFLGETQVAFLFDVADRDVRAVPGPDGAGFIPYALNDAGTVVGAVITGSGRTRTSRAARWSDAEGFTILPLAEGTFQSWATDINSHGAIVVNAFSPSGSPADGAYVWKPEEGLTRLADPAGTSNGRPSVGEAINDLGVVVGASGAGSSAGVERALLWGVTRTPEFLGASGATSRALDVNEFGTIVGTTVGATPGAASRAAAWLATSRTLVDLGPGSANGLNDANVAVGQSGQPGTSPRANLWVIPTLLSVPLGDSTRRGSSNANAVNSRRAVGDADGDPVEYTLP
jgi:hypothetical protein